MSEGVATLEVREPSARYLVQDQKPLVLAFDAVATALCGVSQFRAFICSLAVRGFLVSQETAEESVALILGKARGLPLGWNWARIEEICDVQGGIQKTQLRLPKKNHFPYLRVANIQRDRLSLDRIERFELADDEVVRWALRRGDLLVVEGNGSADEVGRCAMWDGSIDPCVFQNHLMRLRPHVAQTVGFLKLFLNSPDGAAEMKRLAVTTSGLYNLCVGKIRKISVPFPPLAEQHRIVARVEELMKLCDALEQRGRLANEQHARLTSTLFDALAASESAHALAESWQRVAEHFDLLLDRPEAVDALEQTILQLAVRGLLVPQAANDEPAVALLQRLRLRRQPSQDRSAPHIAPIDGPAAAYELPSTWAWTSLNDLVENMGSGWSPACDEGERSDSNRWAVLRTTSVQVMEYRPREHKAIPLKLIGRPDIEVRAGDILITRAGPMNRVGISCWVDQTPPRLMLSDKIVRFHPIDDEVAPAFIVLALNAGWTKHQLEGAKTGMAASQVNISQSDLRQMVLPVCSKSEQHRIVARVEELRRLCADLRQRLTQARETQSRLADALVAEVA